MELFFNIVVSPVTGTSDFDVMIKAMDHHPVVIGPGHVVFDQPMWGGNPEEYHDVQTFLLAILAKTCHEIANDLEEAGFTTIQDLMLKLSEHK